MPRILLIEDEPLVAHLVQKLLRRAGHEVVWAPTGEEGLGRLGEGFDLVVSDLVLPGISGLEVIRQVRAAGGPPVLALSASLTHEAQALESGADLFLGKPFENQALLLAVERLLKAPGAGAAPSSS